MANRLALTIIVSIILTIIFVSLVNVGASIIFEEPKYNDFCFDSPLPFTQEKCEEINGSWIIGSEEVIDGTRSKIMEPRCELDYRECTNKYEKVAGENNQLRYYLFAGIGFVLLLVGLFSVENMFQITGLATGAILVTQGIVINLENKFVVFFSLLGILVIFGVVAWRIISGFKS
ncbi:MAG: hypothetical protein ABIH79_02820 [archaeon]